MLKWSKNSTKLALLYAEEVVDDKAEVEPCVVADASTSTSSIPQVVSRSLAAVSWSSLASDRHAILNTSLEIRIVASGTTRPLKLLSIIRQDPGHSVHHDPSINVPA